MRTPTAYHAGLVARFIAERCEALGLEPARQGVATLPPTMARPVFLVGPPMNERDHESPQHGFAGSLQDRQADYLLEVVCPKTPTRAGVSSSEYDILADTVASAIEAITDPSHYEDGAGTMRDGAETIGGIVLLQQTGGTTYSDAEDAPALAIAQARLTAWYQRLERREVH